MPKSDKRLSLGQAAIVAWGVFGVLLLVGQALVRLLPLAVEPVVKQQLSGGQWALYLSWGLFNSYAEGYRGFHKGFSPRVVARAFHLAQNPRPLHVVFAPFFCMALFHARRKNLIMSWTLLSFILLAIVLIRQLPQPWRGIVDVGVVAGLAVGLLSLLYIFVRAVGGWIPTTDSLPTARGT
jgi:hypothetical protein